MTLALIETAVLRVAIRRNLVSFPAQIPVFTKRGDMEERVVHLYFLRGWKLKSICTRYGLSRSTVRRLLLDWKNRAIAAGYIQEIDPDAFASLAGECGPEWYEDDEGESGTVLHQRHKSKVHMKLLVAVEEGRPRIVGDDVDFHGILRGDHYDILKHP